MEDLSGARRVLRGARAAVIANQQSGVSAAAQRRIKSRRALYENAVGNVFAGADGDVRRGQRQLREEPLADCGLRAQCENAAAGNRGAGSATWVFGAAAKTGSTWRERDRGFCDYARFECAAGDSSGGNGVAGADGGAGGGGIRDENGR